MKKAGLLGLLGLVGCATFQTGPVETREPYTLGITFDDRENREFYREHKFGDFNYDGEVDYVIVFYDMDGNNEIDIIAYYKALGEVNGQMRASAIASLISVGSGDEQYFLRDLDGDGTLETLSSFEEIARTFR